MATDLSKTALGAGTTPISSNVKKDEVYLEPTKATEIEQRMEKHMTSIKNSLSKISTLLTQAKSSNVVTGVYKDDFSKWAKSSQKQATLAANKLSSLKTKFQADVSDYTMDMLEKRIAELEAKLSELENATKAAEADVATDVTDTSNVSASV